MQRYFTDELGNIQIEDIHNFDYFTKQPLYNIETESLEKPPEVSIDKRPILENGSWEIIDITSDCTTDNGIIRKKNQNERYRDGLDEIPKGQKIETINDKPELVAKTLEEQLETNEITQAEYNQIKLNECYALRKQAYINESDGLFFDYQRGEGSKLEWESKVAEIKKRYPKP